MKPTRAAAPFLLAGSLAAVSIFAATPASAATLPDGQRITVADADSEQFFEVKPDGALTAVGLGTDGLPYPLTGIDVDDTGLGYGVATEEPFPASGWVYQVDANTGSISGAVQVTLDLGSGGEEPEVVGCNGVDYTAGVILISCIVLADAGYVNYVGPVDPVSGVLQGETVLPYDAEWPGRVVESIALDPVTGTLWAFTYEEGTGIRNGVYTLAAGGATFVTTTAEIVFGADFDRGGQLWVSTETARANGGGVIIASPSLQPALATLDPASGTFVDVAPYTLAGSPYTGPIAPLTVWGKAALPATGAPAPWGWATGAATLLLVGATLAVIAVIAVRRRDA